MATIAISICDIQYLILTLSQKQEKKLGGLPIPKQDGQNAEDGERDQESHGPEAEGVRRRGQLLQSGSGLT